MSLSYYYLYGVDSLRLLGTELKENKVCVKETAWTTIRDAFTRFKSSTFRELFINILYRFDFLKIPELRMLGKLCIIDGSKFNINIRADWAEYKSTKRGVKLHLLLNLNEMIIQNLEITKGIESEIKVLKEMIEAGITYIADRGYVSFDLFNHFYESNAYFVIRIRNNMCYQEEICEVSNISGFGKVKHKLISFDNDTHKRTYCLVCFKYEGKHYQILTNRLDLTVEEIIFLYACRWQIELVFNYLKNTIKGSHLLNESINGLYIQFYMLAIIQLLLLKLKQEFLNISFKDNDNDLHVSFSIEELLLNPISSIGNKFKNYWKIGIHFLKFLRNVLDKPLSLSIAKELAAM
jgi:IS4 transposase